MLRPTQLTQASFLQKNQKLQNGQLCGSKHHQVNLVTDNLYRLSKRFCQIVKLFKNKWFSHVSTHKMTQMCRCQKCVDVTKRTL